MKLNIGDVKGRFLNNVVAEISKASWVQWDYNGKGSYGSAIFAEIVYTDEDGEEYKQYYSPGKTVQDACTISDNGKSLDGPEGVGIRASSNFGLWVNSLKDNGVPSSLLATDLSSVEGLKGIWVQYAPKREVDQKNDKGYDKTIVILSSVVSLPGESKGSTASSSNDTNIDDMAIAYLTMLLGEKGEIKKSGIAATLMSNKDFKVESNRNAIMKRILDEEFLSLELAWSYKKGVVKAT